MTPDKVRIDLKSAFFPIMLPPVHSLAKRLDLFVAFFPPAGHLQ